MNGKTLEIKKFDALPDSVKTIGTSISIASSSYVTGLIDLCNQSQINLDQLDRTDLQNLFTEFSNDQIGTGHLEYNLTQWGVDSGEIATIVSNMKWLKDLEHINKYIKSVGATIKAFNSTIEIMNQLATISAMDSNGLRAVAEIYLSVSDDDMNFAGQRLLDFANSSYEERINLVLYGAAAEIGIDTLLETISFTSTPGSPAGLIAKLAYTGVDVFLGAKDYPTRLNEMMWSAETCQRSYDAFCQARATYKSNPTEDNYKAAFWGYIIYLENAATVEECYVKVCEMQEDIPLLDTPDYVRNAAKQSSKNAEDIRNLIDEMKACDTYFQTGDYDQYQESLEDINTRYAAQFGGGGGGGTW